MARQYNPLSGEFIATGVIGVLLYVLIIYFSVESVKLGIKSKSTKRFFFCLIVMALLELPRFLTMVIMADYKSEGAYCCHILAGIFFFAAFSLVCRQWSGLLQLGSYFRAVYGRQGLIISNIVFAIVDIVAVVACATAHSLSSYFQSTGFEVITFIEGVRNCVYSVFLAYYGAKLVRRFWHFSRIERQAATHKGIFTYIVNWETGGDQEAVFTKVVLRMTIVLVLTSVCYVLRVSMLIAKMAAVHSADKITTPTFTLFGFLWFCCSDFLPRALPTLAFIFLMRAKKPTRDMRQASTHKNTTEADEYQFVQLADDESFYNLSDRGASMSSATEIILNADTYAPDSKRSLTPTDAYGIGKGPVVHNSATLHHYEAGGPTGNVSNAGHTQLARCDAGEDDANDDDFYSLDDEEWNTGEPSLIDKFFSAITFNATHRAEPPEPKGKGRDPAYDTDIRL
jgi:hypothetical protein